MKFKNWLIEQDGLGGTSLMHGGASVASLIGTNSNMPYGVRSKYTTKDANEKDQKIADPDKAFGFQAPLQKKRSTERASQNIDKNRKAVPMRNDQLDITY